MNSEFINLSSISFHGSTFFKNGNIINHKYINASTYFSFLCFTANEQEIKTYHPVICGESNSYNLFSNEAKEPPRLEIFF